jgi:hypothetical protein
VTTPDEPRGPVPDADPLDELASAIVDGEAAEDPAVADRVARFRAVAELVAAPVVPPSAADRDRMIAAALAAADQQDAGGEVVPFRRRRFPVWLPAAAAVAVLVAGIGLLVQAGGGSDDADEAATADAPAAREAETFEESGGEGEGAAGDSAEAPASTVAGTAGGSGGAATEMAAPADLGDHDSLASLEEALLSVSTSSQDRADDAVPAAGLPCADRFDPDADLYTARLSGQPVVVGVTGSTYVAVDHATCDQVASGTL